MTPRIPRDLSGRDLIAFLERLGYVVIRRSGSHVRLEHVGPPRHALTVPDHRDVRVGTVAAIVTEVARARAMARDDLLTALERR